MFYRYNPEKNPDQNKVMKINERWEELREESNTNIQSEEGILKRQTRSIQTEGHFGDIKENENFRCFNYRSKEKVYKEFMLYAIGRNIIVFYIMKSKNLKGKRGRKRLNQRSVLKNPAKGLLRSKIAFTNRTETISDRITAQKSPYSTGLPLSCLSVVKNRY